MFCYGKITGAAILDETGSGIDSPEKLAAVLGTADAPEATAGGTAENRTLGKAVTADITTDGRGNIEKLVIRSVTDRPGIGITWKSDKIGEDYQGFAEALGTFNPFMFVILFVGINGLVEIIAGFIVAYPVSKALSKQFNR